MFTRALEGICGD